MTVTDKFGIGFKGSRMFGAGLALLLLANCDRMITPPQAQRLKDADAKVAQGDFAGAISQYESALDGSAGSAAIHYKLALLYDDKMNDPLNALHHFKRYLTLDPNGTHAGEVKDLTKRDEITLLTTLSGDSVVTRTESIRLRNENLTLRKQLEERGMKPRPVDEKLAPVTGVAPKAEKPIKEKAADRTYTVQSGDTLFSISRKFYNSAHRWKEIRDANKNQVEDPAKLQPGQTLTIP